MSQWGSRGWVSQRFSSTRCKVRMCEPLGVMSRVDTCRAYPRTGVLSVKGETSRSMRGIAIWLTTQTRTTAIERVFKRNIELPKRKPSTTEWTKTSSSQKPISAIGPTTLLRRSERLTTSNTYQTCIQSEWCLTTQTIILIWDSWWVVISFKCMI